MIKGNFIDNLPKVYGIYTGGFLAFIIIMSIAEQMGVTAKSIGICFQLIDDYLDYTGETKIMGKSVGDDFFNSKLTYPIILTLKKSNKVDSNKIKTLFLKSTGEPFAKSSRHKIPSTMKSFLALETSKVNECIPFNEESRPFFIFL